MRSAIFGLALLASVVPAAAQTQRSVTAVSGEPVIIYLAAYLNADCSSLGPHRFVVTGAAAHGRTSFKPGKIFPLYPAGNPRAVCNSRRVDGSEVTYVSTRGYHGSDAVEFEAISPAGTSQRVRVDITVR